MFTGIINHCGTVSAISRGRSFRLRISHSFGKLIVGESINVNGACVTLVEVGAYFFEVELSSETLSRISPLQVGETVNLERALCFGDRLGGHWVTGHIDETAPVTRIQTQDAFSEMEFSASRPRLLVEKGSISVNGVSLTINQVGRTSFTVMLIPQTLSQTNLGRLQVGHTVNIEYDYLAKVVSNQVREVTRCD